MANEVTISSTLSYTKNKAHASLAGSYTATQTGNKYSAGVQAVATSEEEVDKNDVGTVGFCAFRNMDTTNYIELGAVTAQYSIKLLPGESTGAVRWDGSTVYAKANTAPVDLEYLIIEE